MLGIFAHGTTNFQAHLSDAPVSPAPGRSRRRPLRTRDRAEAPPRRLIVEPDGPVGYRSGPRGEAWIETSVRVRALGQRCIVCGRRPADFRRLQAAHLVSRFELFGLGLMRCDLDERNLRAMCKLDHDAFDFHLGLRRGVAPQRARRLRARYARLAPEFRRLDVERARFVALALAETETR